MSHLWVVKNAKPYLFLFVVGELVMIGHWPLASISNEMKQ
jgi:hypothetical protein